MKRKSLLSLFLLAFLVATPCGWDWDTIQMEKQKFPHVHELMTGKFLRHSKEFYYWRVKHRSEMVKLHPDSLNLYDDLAWALDKIGRHEKAKEVLFRKDSIKPGLYETEANLGTVYIHNGELRKGLEHIKKAIQINPNAHFGREIYQQYVVEYVLEKKDSIGALKFPLGKVGDNFYHFLFDRSIKDSIRAGSNKENELAKAVKGIAGMMKFGNYESPVLLEALGDLLNATSTGEYKGAGHLAARAYAKAGLNFVDSIKTKYVKLAKYALEYSYVPERYLRDAPPESAIHQELGSASYSYERLERALKLEVEAANEWFEEIKNNEISWIKSGVNPDSAFASKYYEDSISDVPAVNPKRYDIKKLELNDAYWESTVQWNESDIRGFYKIEGLDDSMTYIIDSIYREEFQMIPDPLPIDSSALKKEKVEASPSWTSSSAVKWSLIFGALAVAIGSLVFYLRWKSKK